MSEREGGRRDSVRVRKGDVGTEAESQRDGSLGETQPGTAGLEDGGRGRGPGSESCPWKLRKVREQTLP